jgi:hypothetical protein
MSSAKRVIYGSALAVSLGLAISVLLVLALNAAPAAAYPDSSNYVPSRPIDPAQPAAPLAIPPGSAPSKLDGQCPTGQPGTEWGDALTLKYDDLNNISGTVLLKHDNQYLYVCLQVGTGQAPARFAGVYLDTLDTRKPFAGPTDYGLYVDIVTGTASINSVKGTGAGGYTPVTLNGWTAATFAGAVAPFDGAEYQIPLALTGGACGQPFGLAVYHHWVLGSGASDYGWPSSRIPGRRWCSISCPIARARATSPTSINTIPPKRMTSRTY